MLFGPIFITDILLTWLIQTLVHIKSLNWMFTKKWTRLTYNHAQKMFGDAQICYTKLLVAVVLFYPNET